MHSEGVISESWLKLLVLGRTLRSFGLRRVKRLKLQIFITIVKENALKAINRDPIVTVNTTKLRTQPSAGTCTSHSQ